MTNVKWIFIKISIQSDVHFAVKDKWLKNQGVIKLKNCNSTSTLGLFFKKKKKEVLLLACKSGLESTQQLCGGDKVKLFLAIYMWSGNRVLKELPCVLRDICQTCCSRSVMLQ